MAEKQAEKPAGGKVSERQRFHYIGFDVFPGDPKDLFSNDSERNKLVDDVRKRRERHDKLRPQNSLLEERVSKFDRLVLIIASIAMVLALFLPFYSAYKERVEETKVQNTTTSTAGEEVITGIVPKKKIIKDASSVTGLGSFGYLGSIFSTGSMLMLTGIVMLLFTLSCLAVPAYTLFGLFKATGNSDERALKLKEILRFAWVPLLLLVAALVLSFLGGGYGSTGASEFTSFGTSYNTGVFLSTLSTGVLVALISSIVIAVKGIEI